MNREGKGGLYLALAVGVGLGIVLGAAFGLLFDNLALGIGPGTAFGISLGYAYYLWQRDKSSDAADSPDEVDRCD